MIRGAGKERSLILNLDINYNIYVYHDQNIPKPAQICYPQ